MKIEIAGREQIEELMALGRAMYAESTLTHLPLDEERARQTLLGAINDEKGLYCMLIARSSDGEPAGWLFGTITRPWFTQELVAHDHAFFVAPEFRGSRAALLLLSGFRRWAEKRGARALNISQRVGVEMERFESFMRRMGFEPRGMNFSTTLEGPG